MSRANVWTPRKTTLLYSSPSSPPMPPGTHIDLSQSPGSPGTARGLHSAGNRNGHRPFSARHAHGAASQRPSSKSSVSVDRGSSKAKSGRTGSGKSNSSTARSGNSSSSSSGGGGNSSNASADKPKKGEKNRRGSVVGEAEAGKAAKGKANMTAETIAQMVKDAEKEASDFDNKAADVHTTFERRLGAALVKKDMVIKELLSEWDPDKKGTIKKVPFRQHVRTSLHMIATNVEIDAFFDSVDDDGGGSLDFEELKIAMRKLYKAAGAADAEAAGLREKAEECRRLAAQLQEAHDATASADQEEQRLEEMKKRNSTDVAPQLGNLIVKRNLKIGDLTSKWVKKKDVSRADFRRHVLELGVLAEGKAIDAMFDSLDHDGGGSLDLEELKSLLTNLVELAKQSSLDETALEKSVSSLRKVCTEQQQVIAAIITAKTKAANEAKALADKLAAEKAIEDAKIAAEKEAEEARKAAAKAAKEAKFKAKIEEKRKKAIADMEDLQRVASSFSNVSVA